jgi:hypothetical protein
MRAIRGILLAWLALAFGFDLSFSERRFGIEAEAED